MNTASGPSDLANASYELFMESQFWTPDELLELQQNQLGQLLRHAKAQVPFYSKRLDAVVKPNGDINWDRWREIPILSRTDVVRNFDGMQAQKLPTGHGPVLQDTTSGSTGIPLVVRFPSVIIEVCKAVDWRAHTWWGMDWAKTHVHMHRYNRQLSNHGPDRDHGAWGPETAAKGKSFTLDFAEPVEQLLGRLKQKNTSYVSAQGSTIYAFALAMQQRGEVLPLDAVCSFSTPVEEEYPAAFTAAFGANLNAIYSSKEGGRIAHTCTSCGQYHVNAESVLVEILRENGEACDPGETGRVIITPFYNTVQPFIRYDQGDLAVWSLGNSCSCKLPSISQIHGRTFHLFMRRNGERFMPWVPDSARAKLSAQFWQIAQVSRGLIEIRYKPATTDWAEREAAFLTDLRGYFQEDFSFTFRHVDELPLTTTGKFIKYAFEIETSK